MKQVIYTTLALIALSLSSCEKEDPIVTSINLNETSITLNIGDEHQFKVSHVSPDAPTPVYMWNVEEIYPAYYPIKIASISEKGLLKAEKEGETEITVSTRDIVGPDGNPLTAKCMITIKPIAASAIKLNKESIHLKVGGTEQLTCTISPENTTYKKVVWTSSDQNVVTISSTGVIYAKKKGNAVIKATVQNTTISASCNIVIEPILATGITITPKELSLLIGESQSLSYTTVPENAESFDVEWKSSNSGILSVNNGVCIALQAGESTVSVTSSDGKLSAHAKVKVTDPYKKIGTTYKSMWGFDCTVTAIDITTSESRTSCLITYLIKNNTTDKVLNECVFSCTTQGGETIGQYGFFDKIYPGESRSRAYVFDTLSYDPFKTLNFVNVFMNPVIDNNAEDLMWKLH